MADTYVNRCGTCGESMIGSHYHEPECAACGAECEDLSELDPETGRFYCVNCGADLNPAGARVLPDGRPCLAIREVPAHG